ncbi:MAG: putative metal-binding motif-containing protein [Deltaproteobacteria bacterium]|nr:putative metal-binding motif-containing protein [Deltaproteobacteria bacterium]MBK8715764.1 putative metal-binding motif-containing protein [Deltaproteobacteria bacterium]MBP7288157.1 putative metal-binding motif-containing protein [Nannocystaceae bacterium]
MLRVFAPGGRLGRGTAAALAWLCTAACATGDTASGDEAISFGPGGNSNATPTTGGSGVDTTDGVDTSPSGSMTNGSGVDTNDPDCVDEDGDGYGESCIAGTDCNDDDPDVNPGAPETCDGTDENCDDMIDNGCECPDDGVSGNCNMPTDLGPLEVGGNVLGVVGNVPQQDGIDWYKVQFPAAARPGEGTPTIQFAINEDDAFVFDVVAGQCEAAGATCSTGGMNGAAIGLTSWSFVDDDPMCCTPPNDSMVAWPNDTYLRVYRTTDGASCAAYQLQVSR